MRCAIPGFEGDVPGMPSKVLPEVLSVVKGSGWNTYDDVDFRAGFALLSKYNLTFDAW